MKIGPRTWKTAIAVAASTGVCRLMGLDHPVFAGVAAIIVMQPTVAGSVRKGVERMQATVIGAAFALLALIALEHIPVLDSIRPLWVGITVLIVMATTIYLHWLDSLVLAAATVVVIMVLPPGENIYFYSFTRTVVTLVGVIIGTGVNATLVPPEYSRSLRDKVERLVKVTGRAYRDSVKAFCSRDMDTASAAEACLKDSDELFNVAMTAKQWIQEEWRLVGGRRRPLQELESMVRLLDLLGSVRQSTLRILSVTSDVLSRSPQYVEHNAQVYDVLWDLAQVSFEILDDLERRFAGADAGVTENAPAWTEETHSHLIKAMRAAYRAPRDIFPLVEVSVVAFEVRWTTDRLRDFEDELASPE